MPLFAHGRSLGMTNRNVLYLIIGALVVALGVLGYNLYQAKKEPEGLQINVGPNGLKIQSK
jgi:RsiW-degrading membrane proteinase PrsW (M82 family)